MTWTIREAGVTYHIVVHLDVNGIALVNSLPLTHPPLSFWRLELAIMRTGGKQLVLQISEVFLVIRVESEDDLVEQATVGFEVPLEIAIQHLDQFAATKEDESNHLALAGVGRHMLWRRGFRRRMRRVRLGVLRDGWFIHRRGGLGMAQRVGRRVAAEEGEESKQGDEHNREEGDLPHRQARQYPSRHGEEEKDDCRLCMALTPRTSPDGMRAGGGKERLPKDQITTERNGGSKNRWREGWMPAARDWSVGKSHPLISSHPPIRGVRVKSSYSFPVGRFLAAQ